MSFLLLLFYPLAWAQAQTWSSIAHHDPAPGSIVLYRGLSEKEYSLKTFIESALLNKNVPLKGRALIALEKELRHESWHPSYDLQNNLFTENSKTVVELARLEGDAVSILSRYITKKFNRRWKKIRELTLRNFDYEYEFGNGFLYFTTEEKIAAKYGQGVVIIKERRPRGINLNRFHYYYHKMKSWKSGDLGEYVVPVGVPFEDVIGYGFGDKKVMKTSDPKLLDYFEGHVLKGKISMCEEECPGLFKVPGIRLLKL